jgi:hypothetical protein
MVIGQEVRLLRMLGKYVMALPSANSKTCFIHVPYVFRCNAMLVNNHLKLLIPPLNVA